MVDEHRIDGSRTSADEVGHVTAAGALDVVGVDGPAGDRRDGVLELGRLVEAVGVERHGHVGPVGEGEGPVDELGECPVVLVDLEPDGTGLDERLETAVVLGPGPGLEADVERPGLEGHEPPEHLARRLLEAGRDERRRPGRERRGQERRRDQVDVRVDDARGGDQPVAHDRVGVRPDRQVDPVADVRVAGPPDPDDPAVLDPDVGLDDADRGIDDDGAGDDDVELGRPAGPVVLGHPAAQVLGVAPQRLVARVVGVALDSQPEVRVADPDPVVERRAVARPVGSARESRLTGALASSRRPRRGDPRTGRGRPRGSRRAPSGRSRRPGCRGGSRSRRPDRKRAAGSTRSNG